MTTWDLDPLRLLGTGIDCSFLKAMFFAIPVFTVTWIFMTAGLSYRLQSLGAVCTQFEKKVDAFVKETYEDALIAIH